MNDLDRCCSCTVLLIIVDIAYLKDSSSLKSRGASTSSLGAEEVEKAVDDRLQSPTAENEAIMKQVLKEREASQALLAQKQQVCSGVCMQYTHRSANQSSEFTPVIECNHNCCESQ